jgi:hypothetical protein
MGYPHGLGAQVAAGLGQNRGRGQRNAGNLQQNLRGERQRAAYGDQGPSSRDIERSREFEHILATVVAASHKNRNRQRQTGPLATFILRSISIQDCSRKGLITRFLPHLGGQMGPGKTLVTRSKPSHAVCLPVNQAGNTEFSGPLLRHCFAPMPASENPRKYFRLHTFAHEWQFACAFSVDR